MLSKEEEQHYSPIEFMVSLAGVFKESLVIEFEFFKNANWGMIVNLGMGNIFVGVSDQ